MGGGDGVRAKPELSVTTGDWINLAVAIGTIALAAFAFWQIVADRRSRPMLTLEVDSEGVQTRLEQNRPWIRLLVRNARGRRAARGTRVLVASYRETSSGATPVSLAGPELAWPSTSLREGDGAVVFGGTARPLDFGSLGAGPTAGPGESLLNLMAAPDKLPDGFQWWYRFILEMHGRSLFIGREFLPPVPGGYTARLIVGADEGDARVFDVQFSWMGHAPTPANALASFAVSVARPARAAG
jgi:hypothetical protein